MTIGAVVISRNDGYGGAQPDKLTYCLTSLIRAMDEVIYVDWNSPGDVSLIDLIRDRLPSTGRLRAIQVNQEEHRALVGHDPEAQKCVEVLARNLGIRRLNTDYIVSTNGDVLCLGRKSIMPHIEDESTFHCVARRETQFPPIQQFGDPNDDSIYAHLESIAHNFGQHGDGSPLGPSDKWSLITSPGDFQIAHRDVWHGIRGFEESMIRRGYTDSNVQRKADFYGYKLKLVRDITILHFEHYPDTGSCGGGVGPVNDRHTALEGFDGTHNSEAWGMFVHTAKEEVI